MTAPRSNTLQQAAEIKLVYPCTCHHMVLPNEDSTKKQQEAAVETQLIFFSSSGAFLYRVLPNEDSTKKQQEAAAVLYPISLVQQSLQSFPTPCTI